MSFKRGSLASEVERTLLERLTSGAYRDGDRLPPENDLASTMGVSRAVVREALNRLQRSGVVRTVHGSGGGSFVQHMDLSTLTDHLSLFLQLKGVTIANLMEARMLLAPPMASLAAERATDADIEELERIWDAGEGVAADGATGGLVEAFHLKLASMTQNPALEAAARPLIQLVTLAFTPAATKGSLAGEPSIMALQWAVLDAVKHRRGELARQATVELMEAAYRRLRDNETDFSRIIRSTASDTA